jgi:hypothetical protein
MPSYLRQPPSGARPDWGNPSNRALALLVNGTAQVNLLNQKLATVSANKPTNAAGSMGTARTFVRGTSAKDTYAVTGHTGDLTIVFVGCVSTAVAGTQNALVLSTSGAATKRIWFGEASTSRHVLTIQPSGGSAVTVAEPASTVGADAVWVIRVSGTTITLWRNGVSQGSNTIASQNFSDVVEFNVGWTGFLENPNSRMYFSGYYKRAWSDQEIELVSQNIWQLIKHNGKIPKLSGGGGSTNLTLANASQAQTAQSLTLTTDAYLAIADAAQAQTAQNLTLSVSGSVNLSVASAVQLQTAGNVALTTAQWLNIASAAMGQTAQNVVLYTDAPDATSAVIGVDSLGRVYCILTCRGTRFLVDATGEPYALINSPIVIAISKSGRLISLA